jgi:GT2 family glycosyltransferase
MTDKELALVILHYGDIDITKKCLESMDCGEAALYVVNNGSETAELEKLKSADGRVSVISTGDNLGYAGGMNFGIKRAIEGGAKYIAIFNNDILFPPGFTLSAKRHFEETEGGRICFSPLIMNGSGERIWFGGGRLSWISARARHLGFGFADFPEKAVESDFLTGCVLCFAKEAVSDAGFLNKEYFLYWEDIDWSMKLRKSGYRLFVFPDIRVSHLGSSSTGLESGSYLYYYHRNQLRFLFGNCPALLLPFALTGFSANLLRICAAWLFKHGKEGRHKIRMTLKGVADFLLFRKGRVPLAF